MRTFARLVESNLFSRLLALINKVPFSNPYVSLRVGANKMSWHTFDRFLAVLMWKYALHGAYESKLVRQIVGPGMTVVDVGANIGYYTLQLAEIVGPSGFVWAFEPEPAAFLTLLKNIHLNGYGDRVFAINRAVSWTSGAAELHVSSSNSGDHSLYRRGRTLTQSIQTELISLNEFFATDIDIDFIKIDVQGAEEWVLKGASRILSSCSPTLMLELWPEGLSMAGCTSSQLLSLLWAYGFNLKYIDTESQALLPIGSLDDCSRYLSTLPYANILANKGNLTRYGA